MLRIAIWGSEEMEGVWWRGEAEEEEGSTRQDIDSKKLIKFQIFLFKKGEAWKDIKRNVQRLLVLKLFWGNPLGFQEKSVRT